MSCLIQEWDLFMNSMRLDWEYDMFSHARFFGYLAFVYVWDFLFDPTTRDLDLF